MSKERLSNIELLRIIAILMVLMTHFNQRCMHLDVASIPNSFSWMSFEGRVIESLTITAVNVFVMISGYFSIKLSLRALTNLYIRCFIIGLITYLAYILIAGTPISPTALFGRLLAFSHNHWWFVISYLGLMCVSPILNAGCEALSKRSFLIVIAAFSFVMLYFGWWKFMETLKGGYSLISFIYLYCIARYIRFHVKIDTIIKYRLLWMVLYFLCCITTSVLPYVSSVFWYTYDSPFTIVEAICLLLFFISIPFYNKAVNWIAASVFSAYLIQESVYFGKKWLYPMVSSLMQNSNHVSSLLYLFLFTIGTLVICVLVDKLFVAPVIRWSNRYVAIVDKKFTM